MAIMGSFNRNHLNKLFDPVRRQWVAATGEELVRQRCLQRLIQQLGFPRSLLVVEKSLSELSRLMHADVPSRRVDILAMASRVHPDYPLFPLLMIECKTGTFGQEAVEQVMGYNFFVRAPFVAVVNETEEKVWVSEKERYCLLPQLLSYQGMITKVKNDSSISVRSFN